MVILIIKKIEIVTNEMYVVVYYLLFYGRVPNEKSALWVQRNSDFICFVAILQNNVKIKQNEIFIIFIQIILSTF